MAELDPGRPLGASSKVASSRFGSSWSLSSVKASSNAWCGGLLLIQQGSMKNSERPGFPNFCRSGKGGTSLEEFDREVEGWLPLLLEVHLPRLTDAC